MCEICVATASFDPRRHGPSAESAEAQETVTNLPLPPQPDSGVTTPTTPLPTASLDELASYLTTGYWTDTNQSSRSFAEVLGNSTSHVITVDLTGLTAEGQQMARWALDAWELAIDVQFTEVQIRGDITFDDEEAGAYTAYDVDSLGRLEATVNISTDWVAEYGTTMDSYSFTTYVHEIGHALGLGHMGLYNFDLGAATFANDSYQVSVMSYLAQSANPNVDADYALPVGPMIADIIAVQTLYGTSQVTAGDTTWGLGGTYGLQFAALFSKDTDTGPVAFTIYDAGGDNDMINLRPSRGGGGDLLDLNDESFSDVAGLTGNLAMACGTLIEQARMGSGNDTVIGNETNNVIWGDNGRDQLFGQDGDDTLYGGAQADKLYGDEGADLLKGAGGRDLLIGGAGTDLLIGGGGQDRLYGGALDDRLLGQNGDDYLDSGEGNDVMFGGAGADMFFYGFGHDQDIIRDFSLGEDKLVFSAIDFGTQDAAELLQTYGQEITRGIRLDFGTSATSAGSYNDVLVITGVYDLDQLVDDILFV